MVYNVGSFFFGFIFSFLLVFGVIFFAIYRRKHVIKKYPAIKVTVDAIYCMRIAVGSGSDSNMYNIFIVLKDLSTGKKYTIIDSEFDDKNVCM